MESERDWETELPFLKWAVRGDGARHVELGWDGEKFGALCKDGTVIESGSDPRLAEYEEFARQQLEDTVLADRKITEELREQIVGDDDPFPPGHAMKYPRFTRWLEGLDDRYVPTYSELWIGAFYAERIRVQRESRCLMPEELAKEVKQGLRTESELANQKQLFPSGEIDNKDVEKLAIKLDASEPLKRGDKTKFAYEIMGSKPKATKLLARLRKAQNANPPKVRKFKDQTHGKCELANL